MLIFGMHKSSVRCTNSVTTQTLPEMPHTCSLGVTTFCSCLFTACALATPSSDWSPTSNFSALLAQLLLLILHIDHASLSGLIIELCSPLIPFCSLWAITLSHLLTLQFPSFSCTCCYLYSSGKSLISKWEAVTHEHVSFCHCFEDFSKSYWERPQKKTKNYLLKTTSPIWTGSGTEGRHCWFPFL